MKVIAMYLPQFHQIPENDEWWGKGFTEWTAVTSAAPIYEEHYQPKKPLEGNYYNLLDKKTMEWQAQLMNQYQVDGLCFYHYWFKDGKRILEKPAEKLIEWKDVNMPFCFCWANATWARSWSKISAKESWTNRFEKNENGQNDGVLLEQQYGGEESWREHFEYFLTFFKDERYIKINNMPVVVIYHTSLISCLGEMIEKWNQWAIDNGWKGIYVIGARTNEISEQFVNSILHLEPAKAFEKMSMNKDVSRLIDYKEVWRETLESVPYKENIIYGGVVGYDDTPRRGREGRVIKGQTPELFKQYLAELLAKNEVANSPFTFINAWNEWGEGMYLEPDERDGYGYLEAIPYAKENYKKYLQKYRELHNGSKMMESNEYKVLSDKCARYEGYWRILDKWLCNKEDNVWIEDYLISKGIRNIAIYGGGMLGKHLLEELKDGEINVICVIDRKADALQLHVPVYSLDDSIPDTDAIIVTATYAYQMIKEQLQKKGCKNIYSLESIVLEL